MRNRGGVGDGWWSAGVYDMRYHVSEKVSRVKKKRGGRTQVPGVPGYPGTF